MQGEKELEAALEVKETSPQCGPRIASNVGEIRNNSRGMDLH